MVAYKSREQNYENILPISGFTTSYNFSSAYSKYAMITEIYQFVGLYLLIQYILLVEIVKNSEWFDQKLLFPHDIYLLTLQKSFIFVIISSRYQIQYLLLVFNHAVKQINLLKLFPNAYIIDLKVIGYTVVMTGSYLAPYYTSHKTE